MKVVTVSRLAVGAAALVATIAAAPTPATPDSLIGAVAREGAVAGCAREAGETAPQYARRAFAFHDLTLRSGEQMTVAEATDHCLALGQATRILIFQRTRRAFRRVLASVTMPGYAREERDGTVTLPNHDLMQTIFESTFVWNGRSYEASDARSHVYDVSLGIRRPAIVRVRFARGAFSATLRGTAAVNFGQDYAFDAKAGQRIEIDVEKVSGRRPEVEVSFAQRLLGDASRGTYRGVLAASGTYRLSVEGPDIDDDTVLSPYVVRLELR